MPRVIFWCPGIPASQGSKKLVRDQRGRTRMIDDAPAKLKRWRTAVGWAARAAWRGPPTGGLVAVRIAFTFTVPSDKAAGAPHIVTPDLDKLVRAIFDALTSICWVDDCQVWKLEAAKRYDRNPGATIEIIPL